MSILQIINKYWNGYKLLANEVIKNEPVAAEGTFVFFQNKLFAISFIYAMPASMIALVPSIVLELNEGHRHIAIFNIFSLSVYTYIMLNNRIALKFRKLLVAGMLTIFSIILMAFMGSFSLGCMYLFSLSVFIALQFSDKLAYYSVGINFLICLGFAVLIWLKPFDLRTLFHNNTLSRWLIYSVNFFFTDLVIVALIRQLLNGLTRAMQNAAFFFKELENEVEQKNVRNVLLKESESQYKTLFFHSPLPKWIFDAETLQFLQVNNAALKNYGYTKEEFLTMSLYDIHLHADAEELKMFAAQQPNTTSPIVTQHVRKDGRQMHVEVSCSELEFKGRRAVLVICSDITQLVNHTKAIELKNVRLRQIADMQSHIVRVPLANIIGLSDLIMQEKRTEEEKQLFNYLAVSVKELDDTIRNIVHYGESNEEELVIETLPVIGQ